MCKFLYGYLWNRNHAIYLPVKTYLNSNSTTITPTGLVSKSQYVYKVEKIFTTEKRNKNCSYGKTFESFLQCVKTTLFAREIVLFKKVINQLDTPTTAAATTKYANLFLNAK